VEHPENVAGIGDWGTEKVAVGVKNVLISVTGQDRRSSRFDSIRSH